MLAHSASTVEGGGHTSPEMLLAAPVVAVVPDVATVPRSLNRSPIIRLIGNTRKDTLYVPTKNTAWSFGGRIDISCALVPYLHKPMTYAELQTSRHTSIHLHSQIAAVIAP